MINALHGHHHQRGRMHIHVYFFPHASIRVFEVIILSRGAVEVLPCLGFILEALDEWSM